VTLTYSHHNRDNLVAHHGFQHRNAVTDNPVRGVKRPRVDGNEGKTPALSDGQARALLEAPLPETLKGKRDRAIIATFLHHGLRCEELCKLAVRDIHDRQGVAHFRVHGKGSKIRYIPLHPIALQRIQEYLAAAGHAEETAGPLFRPVKNPSEKGDISHALTHPAIYHVFSESELKPRRIKEFLGSEY
jgi:integrase